MYYKLFKWIITLIQIRRGTNIQWSKKPLEYKRNMEISLLWLVKRKNLVLVHLVCFFSPASFDYLPIKIFDERQSTHNSIVQNHTISYSFDTG